MDGQNEQFVTYDIKRTGIDIKDDKKEYTIKLVVMEITGEGKMRKWELKLYGDNIPSTQISFDIANAKEFKKLCINKEE